MQHLAAVTADLYDAVFYATDMFDPRQPGDRFRDKVADQQADLDRTLRETARRTGLDLIDIPRDLTTAARVEWISARLARTGVQPALA